MIEPGRPDDPLVIRDLEFLGGTAAAGGWRPETDLPEVALAGRSNVGKSSLINRLLHRKAIARVSRTPGKTREINYYRVNNRFVLVDLPGYGYARLSKEQRASWRPLIERYIGGNPRLRGIVLLLDSRHEPTSDDLQMLDYLAQTGVPTIVTLTKMDKISPKARPERIAAIAESIEVPADDLLPFSAVTGEGRSELAQAILEAIGDEARAKE